MNPIELEVTEIEAQTIKRGESQPFTLAAGKRMQIRTGTPVVYLLDEQVPAGKQWYVDISVKIIETSA